jgi:nucleotide-binding universal stress UspA family protein
VLARILVPLDGSRRSERALPYAAGLTRAFQAELILVHDETTGQADADALPELERGRRLAELVSGLERLGLRIRLRVVHGAADDAILRAADEEQADLIVMSTHGRSGLGRWLYGSIADAVVRHTTRPVALISAACERDWSLESHFRLLVPLDGSAFGEAALGTARQIADALGAEIILLRVVEPADGFAALRTSYLPARSQAVLDEARTYLDGIRASPSLADRSITTRAEAGDPAARIAAVARDEDVDMIVMATHGSGGLVRLTMGSVATATLHQASVPLLLVRSAAPRRGAEKQPSESSSSSSPRTVTMV